MSIEKEESKKTMDYKLWFHYFLLLFLAALGGTVYLEIAQYFTIQACTQNCMQMSCTCDQFLQCKSQCENWEDLVRK